MFNFCTFKLVFLNLLKLVKIYEAQIYINFKYFVRFTIE